MEQRIQLSDHFGFWEIDPVYNSIYFNDDFTSIYGVVDGYFCIEFCRKNAVCGGQFHYAVF